MSFLGGLVDSFTGAGARRQLEAGMDKATGVQTEARDSALGASRAGYAEARGYLRPYAESGQKASGLYNDTLGVNGAEARARAQGLYNSDDMLAQNRAYDLKRSGWQKNASGDFGAGTAALADARIRMRGYGDWQNRLGQAGQQGYSASAGLADIASRDGSAAAGIYDNWGRGMAGTYQQGYNALAQNENTFAQNLIGVGGLALKASGWGGFAPTGGAVRGVNDLGYGRN